jgi:hypothetical protein
MAPVIILCESAAKKFARQTSLAEKKSSMKDAQKPDHISLNTLIGRLKEGRFVIPDFQREFEWKPSDIIGSLLLWKGKKENFEALACERLYGFTGSDALQQQILPTDSHQRMRADLEEISRMASGLIKGLERRR